MEHIQSDWTQMSFFEDEEDLVGTACYYIIKLWKDAIDGRSEEESEKYFEYNAFILKLFSSYCGWSLHDGGKWDFIDCSPKGVFLRQIYCDPVQVKKTAVLKRLGIHDDGKDIFKEEDSK